MKKSASTRARFCQDQGKHTGKIPTCIWEKSAQLPFACQPFRKNISPVADTKRNLSASLRVAERSTVIGRDEPIIAVQTHQVLATLTMGDKTYRVLGDLRTRHGSAELRFAERKIVVPVAHPELARLEPPLKGVEFMLRAPIALDAATAAAVFGSAGPPAT